MNFDRWFTVATMAGLVGLVILHADNAAKVVGALSTATNSYVGAVQGGSSSAASS